MLRRRQRKGGRCQPGSAFATLAPRYGVVGGRERDGEEEREGGREIATMCHTGNHPGPVSGSTSLWLPILHLWFQGSQGFGCGPLYSETDL